MLGPSQQQQTTPPMSVMGRPFQLSQKRQTTSTSKIPRHTYHTCATCNPNNPSQPPWTASALDTKTTSKRRCNHSLSTWKVSRTKCLRKTPSNTPGTSEPLPGPYTTGSSRANRHPTRTVELSWRSSVPVAVHWSPAPSKQAKMSASKSTCGLSKRIPTLSSYSSVTTRPPGISV